MEHKLIVIKIDLDTIKITALDSQWTLVQIIFTHAEIYLLNEATILHSPDFFLLTII